MKPISLMEIQQIELNLLKEFDKLCKENNLRYYIDGGTLLGAMCYEGFIPWDDDIDLKMPRSDYERLTLIKKNLPKYISIEFPSKENCEYTMAKLIDNRTVLIEYQDGRRKETGVYIDVFPMDGHPESDDQHIRQLQRYNTLFHYSLTGFKELKKYFNIVSRIKGYVYNCLYSPWKLYTKLTHTAKKYEYDKCEYVGLVIEGDYFKETFERKNLDNCVYLQFEDMVVPAPAEYEQHLKTFYGDHIDKEKYYHNLPYIAPDHKHEVYWKDSL